MITLAVLLGTYVVLALYKVEKNLRGRIALAVLVVFTGTAHFYKTHEMTKMLPDFVRYKEEIIYVTGVFEILGAIGLLIPRLNRIAGICLILMFILFLPANIYAAINHVDFGGHKYGPIYLLIRVPLQLFFIWWTYRYAFQSIKKKYQKIL